MNFENKIIYNIENSINISEALSKEQKRISIKKIKKTIKIKFVYVSEWIYDNCQWIIKILVFLKLDGICKRILRQARK